MSIAECAVWGRVMTNWMSMSGDDQYKRMIASVKENFMVNLLSFSSGRWRAKMKVTGERFWYKNFWNKEKSLSGKG